MTPATTWRLVVLPAGYLTAWAIRRLVDWQTDKLTNPTNTVVRLGKSNYRWHS